MRKLLFSNGSPFSRRVRIILAEKNLIYDADVLDALRPINEIRPHNPALQVPVFYDGRRHFFGSDLIVQYLMATYETNIEKPGEAPMAPTMTRADRHWEDMQILTAIGSLSDSMVNIRLLEGVTKDEVPYIGRQQARIASLLDWLEQRITTEGFWPGFFSIMDIYLLCPLVWGKHRGVFDHGTENWPKINSMIALWNNRHSVQATPIVPAA